MPTSDARHWRRATASGSGNACVELATDADVWFVDVRDSKAPTSGELRLPDQARAALVAFARRA